MRHPSTELAQNSSELAAVVSDEGFHFIFGGWIHLDYPGDRHASTWLLSAGPNMFFLIYSAKGVTKGVGNFGP